MLYVKYLPLGTGTGGGGSSLAMAAFGSSPNANGGTISGGFLTLQPADATNPGGVSTGSQTFAGTKTFANIIDSGLTASQAVVTDGSKQLASLAYASANTASALVQRDGSGNFSAGTITATLSGNASTATAPASGTAHGAVTLNSSAQFTSVAPGTTGNVLISNGTDWISSTIGGGSGLAIGAFGSTPNSGGASISGSTLTLQPADGTNPGGVSTAAQTFAGTKTFANIIDSGLTASQAVVTDGSKQLASLGYGPQATGSTIASRDANGNAAFTNLIQSITATTSAGQTINMDAGSAYFQKITGSSTVTFKLPIATNMYSGQTYVFNNNNTSGNVSIVDQGINPIVTVAPGAYVEVINTDNSTTNGVWYTHVFFANGSTSNTAGTSVPGSLTAATSLNSGAASGTTGSLVLNGTTSGAVTVKPQDAAGTFNFNLPTTAGSSGQVLTSAGGVAAPMTWTTPTTGTVTSVAMTVPGGFSISGSPITGSGTLALAANGTSGGIPYYSGATTMASSAALAQYSVVLGGGAGNPPATLATDASTTKYLKSGGSSANPSWSAIGPADLGASTISSASLINLGLSVTASGGTMTIALKQADGSTDPASGSGSVLIPFRDATSANGDYTVVSVTSALSMTLGTTTTLGGASGIAYYVYVYAFNNAGTVTLGASLNAYDEGTVQSSSITTTSNQVIYQASALSSKAVRLIGRFKATNTASSWGSPTEVSLQPFQNHLVSARYYLNSSTAFSSAIIKMDTKTYDTHNAYSTSTGQFTCPQPGLYQVSATLQGGGATQASVFVEQNGTNVGYILQTGMAAGTNEITSGSLLVNCAAGDTLDIKNDANITYTGGANANSSFNVVRLGLL